MNPSANLSAHRVVVESVQPEVDGGRFPVKRIVGDIVSVEADLFTDGHDQIACRLLYRRAEDSAWQEVVMSSIGNDRWRGEFPVLQTGEYRFTVEGWVDHFLTWRYDLVKRLQARQDVGVELLIGAQLAESAEQRALPEDGPRLRVYANELRKTDDVEHRSAVAVDGEIALTVHRYPDRRYSTRYEKELAITVDREKARFSTWYEVFPRSCADEPGRHGTFRDCETWLPYIDSMGFDVLYLPPIHPIGATYRKGKNNAVAAAPDDVGSPWAIGSEEGGHKSIHPALGTFADFERLVQSAAKLGIEVALDIAIQCTPDHPYVRDHPEWFRHRPDGTIQYAENPPKKYQDIYPIDFETPDWQALWEELKSIFEFWIDRGVKIFRVDNPHTKAFPFWEWVILELKQKDPEVLFLAEAFTRPKVMHRLAKVGFSQSYTYFTWRNTKSEITEYFEEMERSKVREFFRPNLWPNTPDILPEFLQMGGRPAFLIRLTLAATLGSNYGIYGPAFELCESAPRNLGSEEYLDSEKYQIRNRDREDTSSLKQFIVRVNRIRRENPALQSDERLTFHETSNPMLLCYSKATRDHSNVILVAVNLDSAHTHSGWVTLDLEALGIAGNDSFQVHDLITDSRFVWKGSKNYVELAPGSSPSCILRLRRRIHTEKEFDYYL